MSVLDLTAEDLPITVTRGTTFRARFTLTDDDGTPIDLTGATVTMTIRASNARASQLIHTVDGEHESPLSDGKTVIEIPGETVLGVDGQRTRCHYELRLIEADGDVHVPFSGAFEVWPTPAPA